MGVGFIGKSQLVCRSNIPFLLYIIPYFLISQAFYQKCWYFIGMNEIRFAENYTIFLDKSSVLPKVLVFYRHERNTFCRKFKGAAGGEGPDAGRARRKAGRKPAHGERMGDKGLPPRLRNAGEDMQHVRRIVRGYAALNALPSLNGHIGSRRLPHARVQGRIQRGLNLKNAKGCGIWPDEWATYGRRDGADYFSAPQANIASGRPPAPRTARRKA